MAEISSNATEIVCNDCQVGHRGAYFITIRVQNGAGLYTVATTDEIKVDLTAPSVGQVIPINDITSCTTNCTLAANVTFFQDGESGVKSCSYAIHNSSHLITDFVDNGLDKTVEARGLQLVAGERYYTVVRCENNVGLVAERVSTIPVLVDDTPPTKVKHLDIRTIVTQFSFVGYTQTQRAVFSSNQKQKQVVLVYAHMFFFSI